MYTLQHVYSSLPGTCTVDDDPHTDDVLSTSITTVHWSESNIVLGRKDAATISRHRHCVRGVREKYIFRVLSFYLNLLLYKISM